MIRKEVVYKNDDGFQFHFEPIEDTLKIIKTKTGWEARYLVQDNDIDDELLKQDGVYLVHYHKDFWVEAPNIITKDDLAAWYNGKKIEQEKEYYIFPVSVLIHGTVTLSLEDSFVSDPGGWDTSHVGAVLVSKKEAKTRTSALKWAEDTVKLYNAALSGDVYLAVKEVYNKNKVPKDYDTVDGLFFYEEAIKQLDTIF